MTPRHVVVGVDGSPASLRALDMAAREAEHCGALLEIVHAVPALDQAGPVLESAVRRVMERHPGLPVTGTPVVGDPAKALVRRGRNAVLTVVGHRGHGGAAGLLLGSVSLRVAAGAHGPLLVVRGSRLPDERRPERRGVLLGADEATDAEAAVYAFREAERRGTALRIRQTGPTGPGRSRAGRRRDHDRRRGLLWATGRADVVVVPAHRRPGPFGPRLSPVVQTLLRRSHCPVVLVPVTAPVHRNLGTAA
ncbi:universal stress protein [Streptomyces sp. F63]|uniref:universal stress protein n=1 Tax=Streptomyces sp. F63 TaxID=2824887 RepID=UPI001B36DAF4|nr:universal stress protein [Streptomyces sp. F63]MBQ0988207.1 universal stress protein [Streptomyces sp. F63]